MLQKLQKIVQQTLDNLNKNWGEYEDEWTYHIEDGVCIITICFDDHIREIIKTCEIPLDNINIEELKLIAEEE